ncbi:MAG: DUF3737 family protein [Bacteroidales bacterium]|nr:DUF3737 family protein [Bacteroidales bacterium]
MKIIRDQEFGGERPLYCEHGLRLENVTIHAGESALKETSDIEAENCRFEGKYPFWECRGFKVRNCLFTEGARAALWYSSDLLMEDTLVEAPKMFREMDSLTLRRVRIPNAAETLWRCSNVVLDDVQVQKGDYLFMHSHDIKIERLHLQGNYSFQYCRNVEIRNSILRTKDAFWESENVTVYDSVITGEYLAWYSKNLRLVNCRIEETQPLCYADNLVLENCTFGPDADLAFEYSEVQADIRGSVTSVKNPRTGRIVADAYGEIILDANINEPADCKIEVRRD